MKRGDFNVSIPPAMAQVVSHAPSCTVAWHSNDLNMSEGSQLSTSSNSRWLVVRPSVLTPGHMYTFVVTVTDHYTHTARANMTVIANVPPGGGVFTVSPREGLALSTAFKFACSNWIDPDGGSSPLIYQFTFTSMLADVTLYSGRKSTMNSTLPVGENLTVSASVSNFLGASTKISAEVQVTLGTSMVADVCGSFADSSANTMSQIAVCTATLNFVDINAATSARRLRHTLLESAHNVTSRTADRITSTSLELSATTTALIASVPEQLTPQMQDSAIELTAFIINASNELGLISEGTRTSVVATLSFVIDAGFLSTTDRFESSEYITDILQTVRASPFVIIVTARRVEAKSE